MAILFPSAQNSHRTITTQPSADSQGECLPKVRIPEIHEAASDLEVSVERLHSRIAVLEDRLSSVLAPIPQTDVLNAVRREMLSSMGQAITARVIEVDQAIARIDYLLEALAV